jgi:hypothetical protein
MNFIDYLFYNIYSWYNKEGTFRKSNDPSTRASFLLGLCVGGWCIFIALIFHRNLIKEPFYQYLNYFFILIALISGGLFHLHYNSTIYWDINKKYKEEKMPYKFIAYPVFFSLSFIFLPFILAGIFSVIHSFW